MAFSQLVPILDCSQFNQWGLRVGRLTAPLVALHPLLGGQWLHHLIPCFPPGQKREVCQLLSKSPNSNTGLHCKAQGGSQPPGKGSPSSWTHCGPAGWEGCLVVFNLPETSSDRRGRVPAPLRASASPFPNLVSVAFLMRCSFALCPFQIECSSISDYSEKIVKANHLDNGKTCLRVFSHRWRVRGLQLFVWVAQTDIRGKSTARLALGRWSPAEALLAGLRSWGSEAPSPAMSVKARLPQLNLL